MRVSIPVFAFGVVSIVLCGCSAKADYQTAKTASDNFHQQMAAANYAAIYDSSSSEFRSSASRETIVGFLQRINRKLGACGEASQQGFNVNCNTSGKFVTVSYARKCANAALEEQFIWRVEGNKALLVRYNANSPVLLTD